MKKEEITRKRNLLLSKEVEELKHQLEMQKDMNSETNKKAETLIKELEAIKVVWLASLEEVEQQKKQYKKLIDEVKELRNSVKGRNAIERWFYKVRKN